MATITKTVELKPASVSLNRRSDLARRMREHWLGKDKSNIGIQYLTLSDGRVYCTQRYERTDLLLLQYYDGEKFLGNVFVEADSKLCIQPTMGMDFGTVDYAFIHKDARRAIADNAEFMAYEFWWLQSKPWLLIDGMTVAEAIDMLDSFEASYVPCDYDAAVKDHFDRKSACTRRRVSPQW